MCRLNLVTINLCDSLKLAFLSLIPCRILESHVKSEFELDMRVADKNLVHALFLVDKVGLNG